jgi:uncharacterized membrane protein (DUF4010 family)
VLHGVGVLTTRALGDLGFLIVSVVGGTVSSASAVAAAASLASQGTVTPDVAASGAIAASIASVLVNFPFILRARHTVLSRQLGFIMATIALCGAVGLLIHL